MPRPQRVILPILREKFPHCKVGSWIEDIDYRTYPLINVRRIGGTRHRTRPTELSNPVVEITVYSDEDEIEAENLYEEVLETLFEAQLKQTQTEHGYIHSVFETMGTTQFSSEFQSTWRVQGLVKVGIRPPRN